MKAVTPVQIKEIDRRTIEELGIPGMVLMENAAGRVVSAAESLLGPLCGMKAVVLAGKGNNGGDAFAAARILHNRSVELSVYVLSARSEIKGDALINLQILDKMGIQVKEAAFDDPTADIGAACLIIDGIFGTGFRGTVDDAAGHIIEAVNSSAAYVLAIDVPSGLDGESGQASNYCIRADATVTFTLPKLGLLIHPGCEYAGTLITADIGVPRQIVDGMCLDTEVIDDEYVAAVLPERAVDSNKGDYGKVFIVTGSPGMTGAGCLAARAALRTGAGLVYAGVPSKLSAIYDAASMESITVPLADTEEGYLSCSCFERLDEQLQRCTVAAVGPGLSLKGDVPSLTAQIVRSSKIPLILDADALNAISLNLSVLGELNCPAVITPHPGEMSRLTGISIDRISHNRVSAARDFAIKWKVITVLKGSRTIIAFPDGHVFINLTGNPGMATGGTGDVLTGIIAGLAAQGLKPSDAAAAGVYIHGLAGDAAAAKIGEYGLIAGDLVNEIPSVIYRIMRQKDKECFR